MEKSGRAKVRKFDIGTQLTYKIQNDPIWYTAYIEKLIPEDSLIVFGNRYIKLGSIEKIRTYRNRGWSKKMSQSTYLFAGAWGVFSLLGMLDGYKPGTSDLIVMGSAATTGWLLKPIFRYENHRMGKRKRLRILDISVE